MPFRTSALDHSNLPINDFSTFIYWKKMYFPKEFLEHYFQEFFELNVFTQEEKREDMAEVEKIRNNLQKNQYYYTRGLENYKLGKAYYKARAVEGKTETYKVMCDMRGLYFFTKAKDTFQKIEGNFLKEKGVELGKYLQNCDFYCKPSSIDGTKCGEQEIMESLEIVECKDKVIDKKQEVSQYERKNEDQFYKKVSI